MMAYVEKAGVHGAALAELLRECSVAGHGHHEGFLLGDVTYDTTNHISDSHSDNSVTEVRINVVSLLATPTAGLFYGASGAIEEAALRDMLRGEVDVVGWYRYRRNGSLRPSMRDRIVSRGLRRYFDRSHFLYCNVTSKQSSSGSTHAFSYNFSRVLADGKIELLEDITDNLGRKSHGYRRTVRSERPDPFDAAIMNEEGMRSVAAAAERALEAAAAEASRRESSIRTVSAEIRHMLKLLAAHRARAADAERSAAKAEETQREESELKAGVEAEVKQEPFDFVDELMRNNLRAGKAAGHKRIHSEGGASGSNAAMETLETNPGSTPGWSSNLARSNHSSEG